MISHNQITIPQRRIKLPYRVKIYASLAPTQWSYSCPGCLRVSRSCPRQDIVFLLAAAHMAACDDLRALNRLALACWNCDGTGRVGGDVCLVCLGRQWTDEPDPTKERRHV